MSRAGVAAVVALLSGAARADAPVARPEAIEVDRSATPPGRAELGFESGAAVGAWAAEVALGYLDRPIVLRAGDIVTYPVERRETLAIGGAIAVGETKKLVLDARMSLSHQAGARLIGLGGNAHLDHWVPGDLALGARAAITTRPHLRTFVRFAATLPTGDDHAFAGEARWTYSTQLVGRYERDGLAFAATGGILLRAAEVEVGDRLVGDAAFGAFGAAIGVPPALGLWCTRDQLRVTGELAGELGDKVGGQRGPSPLEARLGVVGRPLPQLAVGVRAGFGLDDQIGSPRFRAVLEVTWQSLDAPVVAPVNERAGDDDDD
jgi:hypothetical protein